MVLIWVLTCRPFAASSVRQSWSTRMRWGHPAGPGGPVMSRYQVRRSTYWYLPLVVSAGAVLRLLARRVSTGPAETHGVLVAAGGICDGAAMSPPSEAASLPAGICVASAVRWCGPVWIG
ncbi:hypothetical protein [Micromonospora sp. NPDC049891]|uniref:hypothetical protein n=1 Tax=Micromonospora sp. NPDC049891 TaxID=3155655 RepID=UPI0034042D38